MTQSDDTNEKHWRDTNAPRQSVGISSTNGSFASSLGVEDGSESQRGDKTNDGGETHATTFSYDVVNSSDSQQSFDVGHSMHSPSWLSGQNGEQGRWGADFPALGVFEASYGEAAAVGVGATQYSRGGVLYPEKTTTETVRESIHNILDKPSVDGLSDGVKLPDPAVFAEAAYVRAHNVGLGVTNGEFSAGVSGNVILASDQSYAGGCAWLGAAVGENMAALAHGPVSSSNVSDSEFAPRYDGSGSKFSARASICQDTGAYTIADKEQYPESNNPQLSFELSLAKKAGGMLCSAGVEATKGSITDTPDSSDLHISGKLGCSVQLK